MKGFIRCFEIACEHEKELQKSINDLLEDGDRVISVSFVCTIKNRQHFMLTIEQNSTMVITKTTHNAKCDINPLTGKWLRDISPQTGAVVCQDCYAKYSRTIRK